MSLEIPVFGMVESCVKNGETVRRLLKSS
jgi:hypothetical protein